jgi:NADH:ubiquinone oxidoreductase subunit 4 (subunit M)
MTRYDWLTDMNINLVFGIDGVALFMILLTTFLTPICILLGWRFGVERYSKLYLIAFFVLESILIGVFSSLDVMLFYLLFEAVLIPMFLIVGVFGSRQRRSRAAYLLFLYTLTSSVFMLLAILHIYVTFGTTDYLSLKTVSFDPTIAQFY